MLRAMLAEVLRAQGHSVVDCSSGIDAARLATESGAPFDLHVLDLGLPMLGGESVHRRAEEAHGQPIPVVFVSGEPNASVEPGAFQRMRLLSKPFDIADFAQTIRAVVEAARDR
jgi:DNA-binding response OmpR family regulator